MSGLVFDFEDIPSSAPPPQMVKAVEQAAAVYVYVVDREGRATSHVWASIGRPIETDADRDESLKQTRNLLLDVRDAVDDMLGAS